MRQRWVGGLCLLTYPDGRERPVGYASRRLSPAERNYVVVDKETLAAVCAVTVKLHQYVAGREFVLYTDHHPVVCLPADAVSPTASSRMIRRPLECVLRPCRTRSAACLPSLRPRAYDAAPGGLAAPPA